MKILFLLLSLQANFAWADDYCVALRGNGQNVAAHWAAMARVVEDNGMPSKMAGGSSSTVTMFFLDAMSGNPLLAQEPDEVKKREMQALLIKSMPEFVSSMAAHDKISTAWDLMQQLKDKNSDLSKKADVFFSGKISLEEFKSTFQKYAPLINPELLKGLATKPEFFKNEAKTAATVFGHFDAVNDKNIFFRPGIVDFKSFSLTLGAMADFYAGNTDSDTQEALKRYMDSCSKKSVHVEWTQTPESCKGQFQNIVKDYLSKGEFQNKALFQAAGKNIEAIPSTAIIQKSGVSKFNDLRTSYMKGDKGRDYSKFSVDFDTNLSFGYWGSRGTLNKVASGLEKYKSAGNVKSQKFASISANPNWFDVLATSPAEPGLASIQKIPVRTTREAALAEMQKPIMERWTGLNYRKDILSAGGWSDLHPTEVLKASGCERVLYLTRTDGEAVFGQQIFIRLTGLQSKIPFWDKLGEKNNSGWPVDGTAAEDTPWNRLYNYQSNSAFNKAIGEADIVYCTDWNHYEPLNGEMLAMSKQAYNDSAIFVADGIPKSFQSLKPQKVPTAENYPGCISKRPTRGPALGRPGDLSNPAN